ncbi:unnamed protein product, partial [Pleuronectes platessa]
VLAPAVLKIAPSVDVIGPHRRAHSAHGKIGPRHLNDRCTCGTMQKTGPYDAGAPYGVLDPHAARIIHWPASIRGTRA